MKIAIVQDKSKEVTRVTINEKQIAFPEPCYYKLCDLLRLLDAKELSYQESSHCKKSHWVMNSFDITAGVQNENESLLFEKQALQRTVNRVEWEYREWTDEFRRMRELLNAPWWKRIFKRVRK